MDDNWIEHEFERARKRRQILPTRLIVTKPPISAEKETLTQVMRFHTLSGSVYEYDEVNETIVRLQENADYELRRDGEPVKVVDIIDYPEVGNPCRMMVDIRQDGVLTLRTTSEVTRIEES